MEFALVCLLLDEPTKGGHVVALVVPKESLSNALGSPSGFHLAFGNLLRSDEDITLFWVSIALFGGCGAHTLE